MILRFLVISVLALATVGAQEHPSPAPKKAGSPAPNKLFETDSKIQGPITTEIYANEAFFDSNKNMGIFTGSVKVLDPRFNMQADKLTVFMHKGEDQGLERAIADGHVGLVRERVDAKTGGPPQRAIGRSDHAVYTANDGNVEMTGTPKVQQGPNMHVATSADTVMVISQDGQLKTRGPSRTEIRQEPKPEGSPGAKSQTSPSPSPTPTPKNG